VLALGAALAGCTGMVTGSGQPGSSNNPGGGGTGSGGASPAFPGGGASNPNTGAGGVLLNGAPGMSLMHRLNTAEYNAREAS
jgi:hypothetical protein